LWCDIRGGRTVDTAEASAAARGEGGVTAEGAAVLREEEAAKTNVENALSSSNATGDEVTVTKVLPPSTEVAPPVHA
jgi:hypothetical protein